MCRNCTDQILGRTANARDKRIAQEYLKEVGPQTSFYVLAFLIWPLTLAGMLIFAAYMHPEYSVGKILLWSALESSVTTFVISWALLFFAAYTKDPLPALLALRSPLRLYNFAEHFRAVMPRLFVLHWVALGSTVFVAFLCLATAAFKPDEIAGSLGYKSGGATCANDNCQDF